jgi:hypothetical protein
LSQPATEAAASSGLSWEPTTKEPGYVNYDMHQSLQDPAVFYF